MTTLRRVRLVLSLVAVLCAALGARPNEAAAHQCDVLGNSPDVEIFFIRAHPDVLLFCKACGDKAPAPFHVEKVRAAGSRIAITDRAGRTRVVDPQTVYVRLDPKTRVFTNVANRAACRRDYEPATISPSR